MINKHRLECETNIFFFTGLAFFGCLALVSPTVSNQKQCLPRIVAGCQGVKAGRQQFTAGRKGGGGRWGGRLQEQIVAQA